MTALTRRLLGAAVAGLVVLGIAALSRVPYQPPRDSGALIRFSWRTPGAFVEECRTLSAEERERLPIHMRREQVCEGRIVPYRLRVAVDGRTVFDETVRAAGAREDRPLYVFRELPVAPGEYRVEVRWEQDVVRARETGAEERREIGEATGGAGSRDGGRPAAAPAGLALDATLRLEQGDVSLITYDLDRRVLVARGRAAAVEP